MTEREAYIALNMMEKVGPVGVRSLVSHLGSASAIFEADETALRNAGGIGPESVRAIIHQRLTVDWRTEEERALALGARIVTQIDNEYPKHLSEIHDPPLALYVRGRMESRDRHAVAIVGARRPTHYGRDSAERFAFQLSKAGFTIVSGLALGIDTVAHSGTLKAKGRTLGVIGSGLDCMYPESNCDLADAISESGAVISEFPLGRHPDKTTFPLRNRIISALSMGVLVVEAGRKSGALITAGQALEQGRSVFAIPGRIDSPMSTGTNELIRSGAQIVTCVDDVLAEFEFLLPGAGRTVEKATPRPVLCGEESSVLAFLNDGEQDVDGLIRVSGMTPSAMNVLLFGLEMKRMIRMLPGRRVEAVR